MTELTGQVALVTGSSRGLGRSIVLALAERGAEIVVNHPDDASAAEAADLVAQVKQMGLMGRSAISICANVSRADEVTAMFEQVKANFGRLDILVNNAGTSRAQDIFETTEEDWRFIIDTNLTSVFFCSKEAMKLMAEQQRGRIVNISSIAGQQGAVAGHAHYAASKSGILGLTKTLARTGAPHGITVNAVAPGLIETPLLYQTHGTEGVAKLAASVPLGLGRPSDVGLAVAFLCGDGGRYITGATLDVNGGMYLR